MKIESIKISNILSFKYSENIESADGIDFNANDNLGSLDILIGPNASGKSNFLEIVNQIFKKCFFVHYDFKEINYLEAKKNNERHFSNVLQKSNSGFLLQKHRDYKQNDSELLLKISLGRTDKKNLKDIIKNKALFNSLFKKFRLPDSLQIDDKVCPEKIEKITNVQFLIKFGSPSKASVSVKNEPNNDTLKEYDLIKKYFEDFNAFRLIAILNNDRNFENNETKLPDLKKSFSMISSHRNYNKFKNKIVCISDKESHLGGLKKEIAQEFAKQMENNPEEKTLEFIQTQIAYSYLEKRDDHGKENFLQIFESENEIFSEIRKYTSKFLGLKCFLDKPDINPTVKFSFLDILENELSISELSSGQKAIIYFIHILIGHQSMDSLYIIDEPELHLHPQMQRSFLELFKILANEFNLQIIFATHSPQFINKDTIQQTYRFHLKNNATKIVSPSHIIADLKSQESGNTLSTKDLIKILDFRNSSKIFFSNKVILVEGESDEYFFKSYLDFLKTKKIDFEIKDYEILRIDGKGNFKKWREFLNKYEIKNYYLADLDNIFELSELGIPKNKQKEYKDLSLKKMKKKFNKGDAEDAKTLFENLYEYLEAPNSDNLDNLKTFALWLLKKNMNSQSVLDSIKDNDSRLWKKIQTKVENLYDDNIFLLKNGNLECYTQIKDKDINKLIKFCSDDFEEWHNNQDNNQKIEELNNIFSKIFKND